jgi:hypothetical protein
MEDRYTVPKEVTMTRTVVGLFDDYGQAQNVVQELIDNGYRNQDISVFANENAHGLRETRERGVGDSGNRAGEGAGAGAVGGTVLGGAIGLLVGAGLLAIPGIGPVLAAGPLAAAVGSAAATAGAGALGAGIGAAAGGLLGALVGVGIPEEDAEYYTEGVRRGGTLVTIQTEDRLADDAQRIMQRHGAVDIHERGAEWRRSGWTGYNPAADPYNPSNPGEAKGWGYSEERTRDRDRNRDFS